MTLFEIVEEMLMLRFGHHMRDSCKRWVNLRYAQVNAQAEWPWKYPTRSSVFFAEDEEFKALDPNVKVLEVYEPTSGAQLTFMPFDEFNEMFLLGEESGTTPTHWSVEASEPTGPFLHVRPLTQGLVEMVVSYTPLVMEDDEEEPVWPVEFHYALVLGATATGLKLENDPTWEPLEQEFALMIAAMQDQLLPTDRVSNSQYGRDMLGTERIC